MSAPPVPSMPGRPPSPVEGPGAPAVPPFDLPWRRRIETARRTCCAGLCAERHATGGWTGELSSSALSTATAVVALTIVGRADSASALRFESVLRAGCAWLVTHQNADGGWGDTDRSISNISTTTLVWSALGVAPAGIAGQPGAVAAAERWLTRAAGSLEPARLRAAIERRYGDDRTFSIPILTLGALCGRLGTGASAWQHVRQLPFEIAVLPQRWFGALQLPVVSYALPALIAMGQVRHRLAPSRNPFLRVLRNLCAGPTLAKLAALQPANGGFLEAAPLTSFVTMSLGAAGLAHHRVARRGVEFLLQSVRPDGSWPIDTNLATWVTTLSVNALGAAAGGLTGAQRRSVGEALRRGQFRTEHPYTLAAPGGWAWTHLPGGVPDADDTAGALLALHALEPEGPEVKSAAGAGVRWLLDLQNRDGGMPTFCRGWGRLPFDRSSPDLTAHAVRAWLVWRARMPPAEGAAVKRAIARARHYLAATQRADGAWVPLWFGHQEHPADENPLYGTARVVPALSALAAAGEGLAGALHLGVDWLVKAQNADGGWSGAPGARSSVEETGLAVEALAAAADPRYGPIPSEAVRAALIRGGTWLATAVETEQWREPSPIGFYFAKLWYYERLYPLIFATGALNALSRIAPPSAE